MALLGNYSVLLKSPGKWIGGDVTVAAAHNRANFNTSSRSRAIFCGEANILRFTSYPNGYPPGNAWIIAVNSGGMGAGKTIFGNGTASFGNLAGGYNLESSIPATGNITNAGAIKGIGASVSIVGSSLVLSMLAGAVYPEATLEGSGSINFANLAGLSLIVATLVATGSITDASLLATLPVVASLSGSGSVTFANLAGLTQLVATLFGSGSLTADLLAKANRSASLSGSGIFTISSIEAPAHLITNILGSGSLHNTISADAFISGDINVTGDLLTTATVGNAVWAKLLDGPYSAEDLLRIIAAATAGKSSGGPDNPIFRNLADTIDRILGVADETGNRTSVTYNVGS